MDAARRAHEHAVARHREVDARPGEHHRADAGREADDREERDQVAGGEPEEPLRDGVHQPRRSGSAASSAIGSAKM